ncbi:hypothetical protein CLOP_g15038 [Closterium sp. NIES-67]|nr:hypothetical protein CLOP_g15038 [Closterium sp. NIES-67]
MAGTGEHSGSDARSPAGGEERAEQRRAEDGTNAGREYGPGATDGEAAAGIQAGSAVADSPGGVEPVAESSDLGNGWLVFGGNGKERAPGGAAQGGRHCESSLDDSPQQADDEGAEPYQFAQSLVALSHDPDSPVIGNCATCGRHGRPGTCSCAPPLTPLCQGGAAAEGSNARDHNDVPQLELDSEAGVGAEVVQTARVGLTAAAGAAARGEATHERGETRVAKQQQRALRFASSVDVRRSAAGSSDKLANGGHAEGGESRAQRQVAQKEWAEGFDAIERGLVAAVKGFAIGAGLRGGLSLFSLLGRLRRRRAGMAKGDKGAAAAVGVWEGVLGVVREGVRYGMFVGTFAGSYCVLDEGIAAVGGQEKTRRWRALLAGAAAAPSLLLAGPGTRHTSLALYVLLRAVVLAVRCGIKSPSWGWLFRPLTWQHGDTLLMCISAAQILSAWMLEPHSLPPTYVSFLNKHGGKPLCVYRAMKEMALDGGMSPACTADIATMLRGKGAASSSGGMKLPWTRVVKPHETVIPCDFLHPGGWCWLHFLSFLRGAYLRAVPVYVPVYLVPALLVHRSSLLQKPLSIALRTAVGAARSSLFLATYCGTAWFWTCNIHQLVGKCTRATMAGGAFLCGLAVLLEKKSRRMELALYCFSRAIESFFICAVSWGWLPPLSSLALFPALSKRYLSAKTTSAAAAGAGGGSARAGGCRAGPVGESLSGVLPVAAAVLQPHALLDVALLAAAAGVIMQCYQSERDVFRSKYLNVLDWIFGVPKGQKAASELYRRRSPQMHSLQHAKPRSLSLPSFSLPPSAAAAAAASAGASAAAAAPAGTSRAFAGILPPATLPHTAPTAGAGAEIPSGGNVRGEGQQCNGVSAGKTK